MQYAVRLTTYFFSAPPTLPHLPVVK